MTATAVKPQLSASSCALISVNTMLGPGLLAIPSAFQAAGWLPGVMGLIFGGLLTADVVVMVAKAIEIVRDNRVKQVEDGQPLTEGDPDLLLDALEFAALARHLGGSTLEMITQFLLALSLLALACAQIIVTAQAMDGLFVWLAGKTYAYAPLVPNGPIITSEELSVMPFPPDTLGVSAGFLLDAVICIILGFLPLSDNIVPQYIFFSLFIFALGGFVWHFINPDCDPMIFSNARLPLIGSDLSGVLGVVIFNYAFIVAVPSLRADSAPKANFRAAMWGGVCFMWLMYTIYGLMGSLAFANVGGNFLSSILRGSVPFISKSAVFALSFALQPSIPVYVILLSRNLEEAGVPGAVIWANLTPWSLAACCYMQKWFSEIVNWSSLLVLGFINYSIPLALVILAYDSAGEVSIHRSSFAQVISNACGKHLRALIYFIIVNVLIVACIAWNLVVAMSASN